AAVPNIPHSISDIIVKSGAIENNAQATRLLPPKPNVDYRNTSLAPNRNGTIRAVKFSDLADRGIQQLKFSDKNRNAGVTKGIILFAEEELMKDWNDKARLVVNMEDPKQIKLTMGNRTIEIYDPSGGNNVEIGYIDKAGKIHAMSAKELVGEAMK